MSKNVKESKRNGKIEWMRFVFCIVIILFHCYDRFELKGLTYGKYPVSCFARGTIGVEFFFLVSGYLMAKTIYNKNQQAVYAGTEQDLGLETAQYVWKRFRGIFPWHAVIYILLFIECAIRKRATGMSLLKLFLDALPGFFFIHKLGFNYNTVNGVVWYISAMLIAMMILYPICRKYYSMFVHVIAPLGSLYICGTLIQNYGTLTGASRWLGFGFACVFRGIAEIALGTVVFEVARVLSQKDLTRGMRVFMTVVEAGGYLSVLIYAASFLDCKYEIIALLALAVSVTFSFSGQTFGNNLFDKKWAYWLGRISVPLYLSQFLGIYIVQYHCPEMRIRYKLLLSFAFIFAATAVCKVAGDMLDRKWKKLCAR